MFDWNNIDTVLLDMDGTLLDLRFDTHFWLQHVPYALAKQQKISLAQAKQKMALRYETVKGTLEWYCLDYWSQKTQLDIRQLKIDNAQEISLRIDTIPFLLALKKRNIQRVLLTNAHPDSLAIKIKHTGLDQHLDHIYSTHQFNHCKESIKLWQALSAHHRFNPQRTLFIDDNEGLLLVAKKFGVRYVLGIQNPDLSLAHQHFEHFPAIDNYTPLTKALNEGFDKIKALNDSRLMPL